MVDNINSLERDEEEKITTNLKQYLNRADQFAVRMLAAVAKSTRSRK
jgi:uncharacterized protein (DUF2164 family)